MTLQLLLSLALIGGSALVASLIQGSRSGSALSRRSLLALVAGSALNFAVFRLCTLARTGSIGERLTVLAAMVAEGYLIFGALVQLALLVRRVDRGRGREPSSAPAAAPLVAIVIPTCDESPELLERTLVAASSQDYSNAKVWIFDDGGRSWVAALAARHRAGYLARTGRRGGKAGNLNAGWAELKRQGARPEFIAVLDADVIARPDFVRRTLDLMAEPGVALVQTPQFFYTPDLFQRALGCRPGIPDSLRFVYDDLLPAKDASGQAFCCGTSFLLRAAALEEIDGFPEHCLIEDVATTEALRARGWRIVYLDEVLSSGVATEHLDQYLIQRKRWISGYGQLSGRAWQQRRPWIRRLRDLERSVREILGRLVRLAYLGWPAIYGLTGLTPFAGATLTGIALGALPWWINQRLALHVYTRGRWLAGFSDAMVLGFAPAFARWFLAAFRSPGPRRFEVTPKGPSAKPSPGRFWMIGATVLFAAGAGTALPRALTEAAAGDLRGLAMVGVMCWVLVLAACLLAFILAPPCRRRFPRFRCTDERVALELPDGSRLDATLLNISEVCVSLRLGAAMNQLPVGQPCRLHLAPLLVLDARVARRPCPADRVLRFRPTPAQREALIRSIYIGPHVRPIREGRLQALAAGLLGRLLSSAEQEVVRGNGEHARDRFPRDRA